jgi:hypothetical protein
MDYKILGANGVEIENIDDAALYNLTAGSKSGIVANVGNNCDLIATSNVLIIDTGLILVSGFRVKIRRQISFEITGNPTNTTEYQLILEIQLYKDRTVVGKLYTRRKEVLRQDKLFIEEEGIYQVEIATFKHNVDGSIDSIQKSKLLTNSSASIEIDSNLSATSVNPVQNKVVAKALTSASNFAHPKVTIGNDYPNFVGEKGTGENWTLSFPANTFWLWQDTFIFNNKEIVLNIPSDLYTSLLILYAKVKDRNQITEDDFIFKEFNNISSVDLNEYRFISLITIPKNNSYAPVPWLDMGGVPYRWNGVIVENIEVEEKLGNKADNNIEHIVWGKTYRGDDLSGEHSTNIDIEEDIDDNAYIEGTIDIITEQGENGVEKSYSFMRKGFGSIEFNDGFTANIYGEGNQIYISTNSHIIGYSLTFSINATKDLHEAVRTIGDRTFQNELKIFKSNQKFETALEGKLDKYTEQGERLYGTNLGKSTMYVMNISPVAYSIPRWNANKCVKTSTPIEDNDCTPKKYVDDLIGEHLNEFHITHQWYENLTIANDYSSAYISETKLPNPTKIRIESLNIGKGFIEEVGDHEEVYLIATPQTFDVTPDSDGNFSVIVKANLYKEWEYSEEFGEWRPAEDQTPIVENVDLTLDFQFSWTDIAGDGKNESVIFCYNLNREFSDYCTVSLYI